MKLLFVHAHYDDFEFTAAGTFLLWGGAADAHGSVRRRVLVCTDGAAGHHRAGRTATATRRYAEQERAARLGGFEFELLKDLQGNPFREGRLRVAVDLVPALWKAIRDFEPDYLFCPPIPDNPRVGVHADHLDVAEAVRSVAYFINVPQAYLPEYPEEPRGTEPRFVRTPVIVTTYDGYMAGEHGHDLAVEIGSVVDRAADLAWCHESQLQEWLPWVDRHQLHAPPDSDSWRRQYREVLERRRRALGVEIPGCFEYFNVTAWGVVPRLEQILRDFPGVSREASRLERLQARLEGWMRAAGE